MWISNAFGLPIYRAELKDPYAGLAYTHENKIEIDNVWGKPLSRFTYAKVYERRLLAEGIYILAHELGHINLATTSEPLAHSYACGYWFQTARKLGATSGEAFKLWLSFNHRAWSRGRC